MRHLFAILFTLSFTLSLSSQNIPDRMEFCGIDITLDAGAKAYIADVIKGLTKSSTYFNTLADRARMHMPLVEQAFREEGAPEDLKYIGLQESAFRGDAVSSSGAIGYWQFKGPAAKVAGLRVDGKVDERKHIYLSSRGAARYFTYCNKDFDNWIYAIIGYNRGPVGALSFVDKKYYGAKKMPVTKNTHWYALKAIAHKILFEPELQKPYKNHLVTVPAKQGQSLQDIAKSEHVEADALKQFNHWLAAGKIPEGENYTVVVPRDGGPAMAANDKPKVGKPDPKSDKPEPVPDKIKGRFTVRDIFSDPDYGDEFIQIKAGENLVELAVKYDVKHSKLMEWNGLSVSSDIRPGTIIYLKKPKKSQYHIVLAGENLIDIAERHERPVGKIVDANRFKNSNAKIYPGQKLHLRKKRNSDERPVLFETGAAAPPKVSETKRLPQPRELPDRGKTKPPGPEFNTYTVKAGDTLWAISQKFGMTVPELKKLNGLQSNEISVGQKLKVLGK